MNASLSPSYGSFVFSPSTFLGNARVRERVKIAAGLISFLAAINLSEG